MERDSGGRRSREKKSILPKHSGQTGSRQSPSGDPYDYTQGQRFVQQELSPVTGSEDGEYDAPWDLSQRNAYTRLCNAAQMGMTVPMATMHQENLPQDQTVYGNTSTQRPQGQPREGLTLGSIPQGQGPHSLSFSQRHHTSLEKMEEIHSLHYHPHMETGAIPSPIESPLYQEIPYDFERDQQEPNADPDSIYYHKYGVVERKLLLAKFQEQPPPLPPKGISRLGFEKEEPHIYEKVGSTSESCSPSPTTPTGHAYVEIFVTEQNYEVLSKSHESTGIYTYKKGMHFASPSCGIRMAEIRANKRGNDYQKTPYARLHEDGSEASPTGSLSRSVSTGSRTSLSPPVSPNIKTNTASRKNQLPGHPEEGSVTSPSLRQNVLEFQFKEKALGANLTDHVFTSLFDGNKVSASTQHQTDNSQGQGSARSPLACAMDVTSVLLQKPEGSTGYIPQNESLNSPQYVPNNTNKSNNTVPQTGIPKSANDKLKPQKNKPQTKDAASQFESRLLQKSFTQYSRKDLVKIKKKERSESSESDKTMTSGSSDKHSTSSLLKLTSNSATGRTTQRQEMSRESDELQQLDEKEVSIETKDNVNIGYLEGISNDKQQPSISKLPQAGAFKKSTKRVTSSQTPSSGQALKQGSQPHQTDKKKPASKMAYRHGKQTTTNQPPPSPRKIGQGQQSDLGTSSNSQLKGFPFETKLMDYSDSSTDMSSDSEHSGWCHGNQETDDNDIPQSSIPSSLTSSCSSVTSEPDGSVQIQQKYDLGQLSMPYQRQRSCPVESGSRGQFLPRKSSLPQAGSLSRHPPPMEEHIRSTSTSQVDCIPTSPNKPLLSSTNSGISPTQQYANQRHHSSVTLPHCASKYKYQDGTLSPSTVSNNHTIGSEKQRHVSSSSGYSTTSSPDPSIQPSKSHDTQRSRLQQPEQSQSTTTTATQKSRLQPPSSMTSSRLQLQGQLSSKSTEICTQTDHSMRHASPKTSVTTPKLSQVDENVSSPSPSPRTRGGQHFVFPDTDRRPKPFKLRPAQKASFRPARSPSKLNKSGKDFKFSSDCVKPELTTKSDKHQIKPVSVKSANNEEKDLNPDIGAEEASNMDGNEERDSKSPSLKSVETASKLKPPSRLQKPKKAPVKIAKVLRSEEYVKSKGDKVENDPFRHSKDMRLAKEMKTRQWILDQQERVADITKNKPSQADNRDKLASIKDHGSCSKEELNSERYEEDTTSQKIAQTTHTATKTTSPMSPVMDHQISPLRETPDNRQSPLRSPASSLGRNSQISNASLCSGGNRDSPLERKVFEQGSIGRLQRQISSPLERSLHSSREGSPFHSSREVTPSRSLSSSSSRGITPDRVSVHTDNSVSSKTSFNSRIAKKSAPPVPVRGSSLKSPTSPSDVAIVTQLPRSESEHTHLCGPVNVRERTLKFEQKTIDSLPKLSKRMSDPETLRRQSAIPKTKSYDSKISRLQKLLFDSKEMNESKSCDKIQEEKTSPSDQSISPTEIEMLASRGMLARGKRENSKQRETPPRKTGHTEDLSMDLKTQLNSSNGAMKANPTVSQQPMSPGKNTRNENSNLNPHGNTRDISSLQDICLTPNRAELEPKKTEIFQKRSEAKPLESYKQSQDHQKIGDSQCNEEQITQDTTDSGQTGRQHKTVKTNIESTHERLEKSREPVEIEEPVSPSTPEDKGEPVSPTTSYTLCYGCESEADMTPEPEVKSFDPQPASSPKSSCKTENSIDLFLTSDFPDLDNEFSVECDNSITTDTALDTELLSQFSVSSPEQLSNPCNNATRSLGISQGLKDSHSMNTGDLNVYSLLHDSANSVVQNPESILADNNHKRQKCQSSETPMDSHIAIATKPSMLSGYQGKSLEKKSLVGQHSRENTKEIISVMNLEQERSCRILESVATPRPNETEIRGSATYKDTHLIRENNTDKSQNNSLDTENGASSSTHDSDVLTSVEKQERNERSSETSSQILTKIEINDTTYKSDIKQSYSPTGTTSQCEIKNVETPKIPVLLSQADIPHDKGTSGGLIQREQKVRELNIKKTVENKTGSNSQSEETLTFFDEKDGQMKSSPITSCGELLEKKLETTPLPLSDGKDSQSLENQQFEEMISMKSVPAGVKPDVMLLNQHSKQEIVIQNVEYTTSGNSCDGSETVTQKSTSHMSNQYGMDSARQNTIEQKHDPSSLSATHSHEGSSHCYEHDGNRGEKGMGRGDCVHAESDKAVKCDFYDQNLDRKDEKLEIHKNKDIESPRCKFENAVSAKSSNLGVKVKEKTLVTEKQLWKKEEETKIVFSKTQSEETLKAESASGSRELLGSSESTNTSSAHSDSATGLEPEPFSHGTPSLIAAKSDSMSDSGISFSAETDSASQSRTSLITRGESNHSNISGDTIGSNEASPKSSPKHRKFSQSESPKSQLPLQVGFRKMSDPCKPRVQLSPRLHQTSPKHSKKQVHRPATISKNVNEGDDPGYGTWDVTTCKEKGQILFYISHEYEDMCEESLEEKGGLKRKPSLQNPLKRLSEHVKPPNLSPSIQRQESPTRSHSSPDLEDKPQQKDLKSPKFNMGLSSFITDENTLKRSEPITALNVPSGDEEVNHEDLGTGLLVKETSVSESSLHTCASSVQIDQVGVNSPEGSLNRGKHNTKDLEIISRRSVSPISPCSSPVPVKGHKSTSPESSSFNSPLKSPLMKSPLKSPTKDAMKRGQPSSPGKLPKTGIKTPASFARKSASPSPKHESRAVAIETDQACMEVRPKEVSPKEVSPNSKKSIPKFSFPKKKSPEKEVNLSEKPNKFVAEILKRQKSPPKSSTLSQKLGGDPPSGSARNLSRKVSPQDNGPSGSVAAKATGTRLPNPSKGQKDGGLKKPGFATKLPSFRAPTKTDTKPGQTSPDTTEKPSKSPNEPKGKPLPKSRLRLPKQRSADSDKTDVKPNTASNRGSV